MREDPNVVIVRLNTIIHNQREEIKHLRWVQADRIQHQDRLIGTLQAALAEVKAKALLMVQMGADDADWFKRLADEIDAALTQSGNGGTAKHNPETCHVCRKERGFHV